MKILVEVLPQAAHGGDAHGAGQDGGVAVARALLGGNGQDLFLIQLDGLGGCQIVGTQDDGHIGVDASLHHPHEVI